MHRFTSVNRHQASVKDAPSFVVDIDNLPAFDPFHYEFDAVTIIEPFTYFHNGPTEGRQKSSVELSSNHCSWTSIGSRSSISTPEENSNASPSPSIADSSRLSINRSQPASSPSKTICRHCKSHNMPECLYTSHSMYDENGDLFCPVLKKCHCASCVDVTSRKLFRDDEESDDEQHLRSQPIFYPSQRLNLCARRPMASPTRSHNNTF